MELNEFPIKIPIFSFDGLYKFTVLPFLSVLFGKYIYQGENQLEMAIRWINGAHRRRKLAFHWEINFIRVNWINRNTTNSILTSFTDFIPVQWIQGRHLTFVSPCPASSNGYLQNFFRIGCCGALRIHLVLGNENFLLFKPSAGVLEWLPVAR
jgi:hypothetical protein